jgi:hypothetical protein
MADVPVPELMARPRTVHRWAPVVVWMAAIFFASSLPRLGAAGRIPDWITHPVAYAVGGALMCRALTGEARPTAGRLALAALLTTAYGVSDEVHQSFVPGRDADPMDVVKDFLGAAAASLAYRGRSAAGVSSAPAS